QIDAVIPCLPCGVFQVHHDTSLRLEDVLYTGADVRIRVDLVGAALAVSAETCYSREGGGGPLLREPVPFLDLDRGHISAEILAHLVAAQHHRGEGARRRTDGPLVVLPQSEDIPLAVRPEAPEVGAVDVEVVLPRDPLAIGDIVDVEQPSAGGARLVV